MADAFLQVVFENLNSVIQMEVGLLWGVDEEMEKLSSTLTIIRAVLEDAEEKQVRDKAIQNWLLKLKDTAHDIDDILDECATEALRLAQNSSFIDKVHTSFFTCCHLENVLFRHKIGKKMKEIRERLDEIAEERIKFHLRSGILEERRVEAAARRQTGSILTQPEVYGREEDKDRIVEVLVKHVSNCEHVSIYPIIGMGGLGKTTLAQLVFNDERVKGYFEPRIWVCISDDFDVKRSIRAIIQSASGHACEDLELDPLQRRLREMLNGKRYLLVLDDVWNEDQEKWDKLKFVLACGSEGATIIVTTRVEKVASIMGNLPSHRLSGLSEDDCWSLFRRRAFGNEAEERPNIVAIGKEIVKKCGGVPLAAKALGSLMRFKREENEWLFVKESEIWNLPQEENSILPALRLSYYNLPLELRQCFAFCAVYPKDYEIGKEDIIDLWMANGFISSNGILGLEDIGNEIWNELYWRSFFQDVKKDIFSNVTSFKMHDLVHDLAQSVMVDECCIIDAEKSTKISRRIRHVSLVANLKPSVTIRKVEFLQTLLLMKEARFIPARFTSDFLKFVFLRAFDASGAQISKVSSSIGKLKHLRYLDLSHTLIRMLPETICSLWNLQTLKIEWCYNLERLPQQISRLRNLRHLYMDGCFRVTQMASKIGQLTCLKVLSFFIVGERNGFHLGELQALNLRGKLRIEHLERVKNLKDAKEANLIGKQNLRKLVLSWRSERESELHENAGQVLESLEPSPTLVRLVIEGYRGTHFPLWMMNQVLEHVVHIELSNCKNCLELPPFGKLSSLRILEVHGMNHVEYIDNESHGGAVRGFPSLETLWIYDLPSLKRLSREEGRELLPRLTSLHIHECPEFSWNFVSNLQSLTSLVVSSNVEVTSFPDGMLRNFTALQNLAIQYFTKLEVLPTDLVSLIALKSLVIVGCQELESLPEQGLRGLTSLQNLWIDSCKKLKSLSEGLQHLTALESLNVGGCPELVALPEGIMHLNSLQRLTISDLVVLPEALRHVPALQSLEVSGCPDLASLPDWLGDLKSLQLLTIRNCPKIASLPPIIQSLTKLRQLNICGSSQLERRCEKEIGEDWPKISHIPRVYVN